MCLAISANTTFNSSFFHSVDGILEKNHLLRGYKFMQYPDTNGLITPFMYTGPYHFLVNYWSEEKYINNMSDTAGQKYKKGFHSFTDLQGALNYFNYGDELKSKSNLILCLVEMQVPSITSFGLHRKSKCLKKKFEKVYMPSVVSDHIRFLYPLDKGGKRCSVKKACKIWS
jgi:hypothetical protein